MDEIINILIQDLKKQNALSTKDLSDRFYKIQELFDHRLTLVKILFATYKDQAWKSLKHYDGTMFNGDFIVGINTPMGPATFHFKLEHFNEFDVKEIPSSPEFDNHTPIDDLIRLQSLPLINQEYIQTNQTIKPNNEEITYSDEDKQKLADILNQLFEQLRKMDLLKTVNITTGHHNLKELYTEKRELFKLICHDYSNIAWKSIYDQNGNKISDDTFIVGLNTPNGPVCYVLNIEHFNEFNIQERPYAPIKKEDIYQDVLPKLTSLNIRHQKNKINTL